MIDGVALPVLGARAYREQVGAVMQEDQLLSGSVADNICFFDPSFDQQRMIQCASFACIHEEILSMPMTYNTLIGDMGSSLSGGRSSGYYWHARSIGSRESFFWMRAPHISTWRMRSRSTRACGI